MNTTTMNVVIALQSELRQKLLDLRGTPAFADALAVRERELGVARNMAPDAPGGDAADAVRQPAPSADSTLRADGVAGVAGVAGLDRFGNVIVGELGRFGQYRVVSAWDGRTVRVCGAAATAKHLPLWSYDAGERRMVCRWCWPGMAGGEQVG